MLLINKNKPSHQRPQLDSLPSQATIQGHLQSEPPQISEHYLIDRQNQQFPPQAHHTKNLSMTEVDSSMLDSESSASTTKQDKFKLNFASLFKMTPRTSSQSTPKLVVDTSTSSPPKHEPENINSTTSKSAMTSSQYLSPTSITTGEYTIPNNYTTRSTPNHPVNYSSNHTNVEESERYTSFTAECISLQNSEMTSYSEFEPEVHNISSIDNITQASHPPIPPHEIPTPKVKKSLRNLLRLSGSDYDHKTSESDDSDEDITAYLSESESDLNFNPKNEENESDYRAGGYHPVARGEIYYSRKQPKREYIILRKLGWGHFSTVWLAKSRYNPNLHSSVDSLSSLTDTSEYYVAMKFVKSNKNYMDAARDEIKILNALNYPGSNHFEDPKFQPPNPSTHQGYKHVMKLLDDFEIEGPNGTHICMVFEILGENILNLTLKYKQLYANVKKEIGLRKESLPTSTTNSTTEDLSISPSDVTNPSMKFSKWDSKNTKKNTRSKLSMGLNLGLNFNLKNSKKTELPACPQQQQIIMEGKELQPCAPLIVSSDTEEELIGAKLSNLNSESLMHLIERQKNAGAVPLNLVRQIARQMFLAMDYVHRCGVIHTDLKPENILVEVKEVDSLIRILENERINRSNSIEVRTRLTRKNSSRSNSLLFNSKKLQRTNTSESVKSRNQSTSSTGSNNNGTYKKSRNSISGSCECPVRSSKPLSCSSFSSEVIFKEVAFETPKSRIPHSKSISPKFSKFTNSASSSTSALSESSAAPMDAISVKIADLGNATFSNIHFTNQIQTRQYRSPEIIMKYKTWGASTDMWSLGCILFELITGDYLFDPCGGKYFDKDEDHLAQIIELLGHLPSDEYLIDCKLTSKYFKLDPNTNEVILKNIDNLKYWCLEDVLVEKYKFDRDDIQVKLISDLILKCLRYNVNDRYDCNALLSHPWLREDITDFSQLDEDQLLKDMANLPNDHNGIPGFSSTWGEDDAASNY